MNPSIEGAQRLNNCGQYILVHVLRPRNDYSNGGVSSNHDQFFAPCFNGNYTADDVKGGAIPTLEVRPPSFPGCPYRFIVHNMPTGMAGGNWIYTSDSRFTECYGYSPIALLDRFE